MLARSIALLLLLALTIPTYASDITLGPDDWAQWRGPSWDGVAPDQTLPTTWDDTTNVRWKTPIPGRGHGSTIVHEGGFDITKRQGNPRSTRASSTPPQTANTSSSPSVTHDAVYITALSLEGEQLWQHKVSDYKIHQGYGSSPTVYKSLAIASVDTTLGGAIVAYDRVTGERVWYVKRAELPNYPSPTPSTAKTNSSSPDTNSSPASTP